MLVLYIIDFLIRSKLIEFKILSPQGRFAKNDFPTFWHLAPRYKNKCTWQFATLPKVSLKHMLLAKWCIWPSDPIGQVMPLAK